MSLIKCPDCKRKISSDCEACPNCGAKIKERFEKRRTSPSIQQKQAAKEKKPTSKPILILWLIFFFPVGLYLMWTNSTMRKKTKIFITAFFVILVALYSITGNKDKESNQMSPTRAATQASVKTSTAATEPTTTEPETTAPELTQQEQFIQTLLKNPDVKPEAAQMAYDTLIAMGFEKIDFKSNETMSAFEGTADTFKLKVIVNDKLYKIICGGYNLYDNDKVLYTKQDLLDRSIDSGDKVKYVTIAQEIISSNLKNPTGAHFSSLDETQVRKLKDIVAVSGYVDATNSLNATIRSKFLVEFQVINLDQFSYNTLFIQIGDQKTGTYQDIK